MNYSIKALTFDNQTLNTTLTTPITKNEKEIAFVFHIFYADIWREELKPYLDAIKIPYDLFITVPDTMLEEEIIHIFQDCPHVHLYQTENRGRDVLPFLQILHLIGTDNYQHICKIHTKKSAGRDLGTVWRKLLYYDLIGSNKIVLENLALFENHSDIAMITGKNTVLDSQKYYLGNREKTDTLIAQCQLNVDEHYTFAGGTMFWVDPKVLEPLVALFRKNTLHFEEEKGQMDNTLAHAIERFLGILCHASHKKIVGSTAAYKALDEQTLQSVASLVLSQTYVGRDMFLEQKNNIAQKDTLISTKTQEIIEAHQGMQTRDEEIRKAHHSLQEAIILLEIKDKQIDFLTTLTLKTRIKQKIKKFIPNKILTILGFSAYTPLELPTNHLNNQ